MHFFTSILGLILLTATVPCNAETLAAFQDHYSWNGYATKPAAHRPAAFSLTVRMRQNLWAHIGKTDPEKLSMRLESDPGVALTDAELATRAEHLTELIEQLAGSWGFEIPALNAHPA